MAIIIIAAIVFHIDALNFWAVVTAIVSDLFPSEVGLVFHDFGEDFCAQEDVHHQTAQDIDDDGHIHDNIVFSS